MSRAGGAAASVLALLMALVMALVMVLSGCGSAKRPTVPHLSAGTVTDSGFRPVQDGLPFQNYGDALDNGVIPSNMTAADVEKMFGDVVCADAQSRKCDLIPQAQDWLDETNQAMAGGHCYGFSVLADLFWQGKLQPAAFGAASVTSLQIVGNAVLQRQIAYDWALQTLPSVQSTRITGTPNKILLTLMSALKRNAPQAYTVLFWKRDGTGGHAVTPYAVVSRGDGKFDVLIYDNNWPDLSKAISFDTRSDTWSYDASTVPGAADSLYEGNGSSKTIALDPASPGLGKQPCPFCGKVPTKPSAPNTAGANLSEVSLLGDAATPANLVVTDDAGHKLGYIGGQFVNQIKGAYYEPIVSNQDWSNKMAPNFYVPADRRYAFTIDGSQLTSVDHELINIVGPSYDVEVKGIALQPGEKDTLVMDPDATHVSYKSSRPESPIIDIGVSDTAADYTFELAGIAATPGGTVNVALPAEGSTISLQTVGSEAASTVSLKMTRETETGVQVFEPQQIQMSSGELASLQFGRWAQPQQPAPLVIAQRGVSTSLADQTGP